jgi:ABC-2 type transport system permease protein
MGRVRRRALLALAERETLRVARLWTQTILPPVFVSALFIVVFGVALGDRIRSIGGVPYESFIVPGLTLMGVGVAAFTNTATSLFQARNDGFIEDPASSPMGASELLTGYLAGGVVRGLAIGLATLVVAALLVGVSLAFAALGVVVGLHSKGWEQQAVVGQLVLQPLAFLGGTFYAVDAIDEPWRTLTHADPLLYMVAATRHAMLGGSEVPLAAALGVTFGLGTALLAWAWWAFRRGVGIRT